jgi:hypothetical protein
MTTKKKILKGSGISHYTPRRHRTIHKEKTMHRIINEEKTMRRIINEEKTMRRIINEEKTTHKNDKPFINPFYYQGPIIKKNISFDTAPYDAISEYTSQHPDKNITYEQISKIINDTVKKNTSDDKKNVKEGIIDSELLLRICDF